MITNDEIERCFRAIRDSKTLVYDVETTGLDWKHNHVIGYVLTVGPRDDETWYLPVRHAGGGNIEGCRVPVVPDGWQGDIHWIERRLAQEVAVREDLLLVGHHLKFDMHFSANHGIFFQGATECTQVNAALINENQGKFDLDTCAEKLGLTVRKDSSVYDLIKAKCKILGVPCEEGRKSMANFWRLSGEEGNNYARADGATTWHLKEAQTSILESEDLLRVHSLEKRVTKTLFRVERRGVPADMNMADKVSAKVAQLLAEGKSSLPQGLNARSNADMKRIFTEAGITDWPMTAPSKKFPNGQPSFTEEFLDKSELGKKIITVRKLENLVSTFIEGSIGSNIHKGRIHTTLNQMAMDDYGTVTGRLSSSGPNLQQIPKRNKVLAPLLRQIYREKGKIWRSSDFKSQEYRVFADFAGAAFVLEAYARDADTDYHQLVADLLGVVRDPIAKRLNLGTIYGIGKDKMADQLGCSVMEASALLGKMRAMMPEAKAFMNKADRRAKERGFVKTILGRRRRFGVGENTHKAGNSVIQGTCADITKQKMVEIDEFLVSEKSETQMILQIHDSLEFLMPSGDTRDADRCMEIMQQFDQDSAIQLRVPMRVDIGDGISWGHATFPKYKEWL